MSSLRETIDALAEGISAASDLGLDTTEGKVTAQRIEARLGFEGSTYVIALAGGTGVGKSSVLNALAGAPVSTVRAIRPTTARPLAWVEHDDREDVAPLIEWIGVDDVVTHRHRELADVAILDLPDVDSVALEHRAIVDDLLPRIDAVFWVVDSEKYDDERLHGYLRRLAAHGDRMVFLFNKAERLTADERSLISEDFERRLSLDGIARPQIRMVSAQSGLGIDDLRSELAAESDRKAKVVEKLRTDARAEIRDLAAAAGVEDKLIPLIDRKGREAAERAALRGALTVVDPSGLSRQIQAAVLNKAKRQGGSLLARLLAVLTAVTGTRKRVADPEGFLLNWRARGSLGHVLNPIRRLVVDALAALPAGSRLATMNALGFDDLEDRLVSAVDRAVRASRADVSPPRSFLWGFIGIVQLVLGAVFLFSVAWYVIVIFGPGGIELGSIDLPYLGPVPVPLVLLVGSLLASFLLGALLSLHAGWIGRRQGRQIAARVEEAVEKTLAEAAFAPIDALENARSRLYQARDRTRDS